MSVNVSTSVMHNSTTGIGINSSLKSMFITEGENLVLKTLYNNSLFF